MCVGDDLGKHFRTAKIFFFFFFCSCSEMTAEYACTRRQFGRSLSEFGLIQVRRGGAGWAESPLAGIWGGGKLGPGRALRLGRPGSLRSRSVLTVLLNTPGEVCPDGAEGLRDGKHGLPHGSDAGRTWLPRLLHRGCHGEGNPHTAPLPASRQPAAAWARARCPRQPPGPRWGQRDRAPLGSCWAICQVVTS